MHCRETVTCRIGLAERAEPSVMIWGDSHAASALPGVDSGRRERSLSGYAATKPACPPLLGVRRADMGPRHRCIEFNEQILDFITEHPEIRTVILVARWAFVAEGTRPAREIGPDGVIRSDHSLNL